MSDKERIAALEARIAALEARLAALELREHYQKHGNVNPKIYGPVISDGGIPLS